MVFSRGQHLAYPPDPPVTHGQVADLRPCAVVHVVVGGRDVALGRVVERGVLVDRTVTVPVVGRVPPGHGKQAAHTFGSGRAPAALVVADVPFIVGANPVLRAEVHRREVGHDLLYVCLLYTSDA